jgi:hypothetical protein
VPLALMRRPLRKLPRVRGKSGFFQAHRRKVASTHRTFPHAYRLSLRSIALMPVLSTRLADENLFLRRQLAQYLER